MPSCWNPSRERAGSSRDPVYLSAVREFCSDRQLLLIFDEVQTGIGTGELFAPAYGVKPDIVSLAKDLRAASRSAQSSPQKRCQEASSRKARLTFGGNFLACAAGLATLT